MDFLPFVLSTSRFRSTISKGMFSPAYFQFSSIQFSSDQFSSDQFSSALDNTFTLTYHYSVQFSSLQFRSDQFRSVQLNSVQFSPAVLCRGEQALSQSQTNKATQVSIP